MVCAFTGHRPERLSWGENEDDARCLALKQQLARLIGEACGAGCRTFVCGMARGCDLYFAEAVLALRSAGSAPEAKLCAMVPCPSQPDGWRAGEQARYRRLLAACDSVEVLEPGYSAGCSDFSRRKPLVMEQDRCNQFIDQGIREFRLWLNAGPAAQRLERVETEAIVHHETPFALSCFPDRQQPADSIRPLVELDDSVVQMTAFKRFYRGEDYLIRLFEPTGTARSCTITLPCRGVSAHVDLQPFEIVSLRYSVTDNTITRTDLLEQTF